MVKAETLMVSTSEVYALRAAPFEATRSEPRSLVFTPSAWARRAEFAGRRAATSKTEFAPLV
jgi:hypothetical protein